MSVLKSLQFVSVPKPNSSDPRIARRQKFLVQLERQLELAKDENFVICNQRWVKQADGSKQLVEAPRRVKRWWHIDAAGSCFLILRYGNKLISIAEGKAAIAVGDRAKLAGVLEVVIAATRDGELDVAIEGAKTNSRANKRKAA